MLGFQASIVCLIVVVLWFLDIATSPRLFTKLPGRRESYCNRVKQGQFFYFVHLKTRGYKAWKISNYSILFNALGRRIVGFIAPKERSRIFPKERNKLYLLWSDHCMDTRGYRWVLYEVLGGIYEGYVGTGMQYNMLKCRSIVKRNFTLKVRNIELKRSQKNPDPKPCFFFTSFKQGFIYCLHKYSTILPQSHWQ